MMNESRMVAVDDILLSVHEEGTGDPVVLVHGFPELAYSWRHQIPALAAAGYRAIAYDQRGYGASDKPENADAYRLETLVADLVGLLDALDVDKAVLVGHDWGSIVVWTAALRHPNRIRAIVSINVPYHGRCCSFPPVEFIRERLADRFGYVLMFQERGKPERQFEQDPAGWLQMIYTAVAADGEFQSYDEFHTYVNAFAQGGIAGPINYYRNLDTNWEDTADLANALITQPTLMIAADGDPVLPASSIEGMDRWVPNLETVVVAGSGHWTQQEQPEAVNSAIIGFLNGLQ